MLMALWLVASDKQIHYEIREVGGYTVQGTQQPSR